MKFGARKPWIHWHPKMPTLNLKSDNEITRVLEFHIGNVQLCIVYTNSLCGQETGDPYTHSIGAQRSLLHAGYPLKVCRVTTLLPICTVTKPGGI